MRIALLAHGYPPREPAGTETYTLRLAEALRARGDTVKVFVAAPVPGASPYAVEDDGALWRCAQNAPYGALRRGGSDPAIDALLGVALSRFRPEVVYVQHLQNLSTTLRLPAPYVWMLHDAWAWCPAGGTLLRDGVPCEGPQALADAGATCARCASGWVRDPPAVTAALDVAGRLARWIPPARLHAAWRRLPPRLRDTLTRSGTASVTPGHIQRRDVHVHAFADGARALLSPSAWLAKAARAEGLPSPRVVPHGVDPLPLPRDPDGPFVFLGTLAPHKGPDLVREAHRRAGARRPLRIHGPPGPDAAFVGRLGADGPLDPDAARRALAGARALVLGSRWPENAPLVALEARAQGCPVIAPAIGGLPELVEHGVDGLLVPPNDADALASAIRTLDATPLEGTRPPRTFQDHVDEVRALLREVATGASVVTPSTEAP